MSPFFTYWTVVIPVIIRMVTAVTSIKLTCRIVVFIIAITVTNPVFISRTVGRCRCRCSYINSKGLEFLQNIDNEPFFQRQSSCNTPYVQYISWRQISELFLETEVFFIKRQKFDKNFEVWLPIGLEESYVMLFYFLFWPNRQ